MAEALGQLSKKETVARSKGWLRGAIEWLLVIGVGVGVLIGAKFWMARGLLPADGTASPDIGFIDLTGRDFLLSDFKGKPVLLHFWAPWCTVCKFEVDSLNDLNDSLNGRAAVVAIALRATEEDVATAVKNEGIRYPVYLGSEDIGYRMKVQQLPTTYVIDSEGRVVARDTGWSPSMRLHWMLEAAAEAP